MSVCPQARRLGGNEDATQQHYQLVKTHVGEGVYSTNDRELEIRSGEEKCLSCTYMLSVIYRRPVDHKRFSWAIPGLPPVCSRITMWAARLAAQISRSSDDASVMPGGGLENVEKQRGIAGAGREFARNEVYAAHEQDCCVAEESGADVGLQR